MRDLDDVFGELPDRLPIDPESDDSDITLNAGTCPFPGDEVFSERLKVVARPLGHCYGDSARYDAVHFFADKGTYRRLGLLLFSAIFHPNRKITLHARHAESTVSKIRIECWTPDPGEPHFRGLASVPVAFGYSPDPVEALHPLVREEWRIEGLYEKGAGTAAYRLPQLELTNDSGRCGTEAEFAARNIVDGFGGPEATATLAALLLDIALPQTELTEFCLEGPAGNWSVAIGSAEARFWIGYEYH